MFWFSPFLY